MTWQLPGAGARNAFRRLEQKNGGTTYPQAIKRIKRNMHAHRIVCFMVPLYTAANQHVPLTALKLDLLTCKEL